MHVHMFQCLRPIFVLSVPCQRDSLFCCPRSIKFYSLVFFLVSWFTSYSILFYLAPRYLFHTYVFFRFRMNQSRTNLGQSVQIFLLSPLCVRFVYIFVYGCLPFQYIPEQLQLTLSFTPKLSICFIRLTYFVYHIGFLMKSI